MMIEKEANTVTKYPNKLFKFGNGFAYFSVSVYQETVDYGTVTLWEKVFPTKQEALAYVDKMRKDISDLGLSEHQFVHPNFDH